MPTLHTFGCSITQGHALPDLINPVLDEATGLPLTPEQIQQRGITLDWNDIHILAPSQYAWPQVLADKLDMPVENYARRGACFNQIARQCAVNVKNIQPEDTVIVMWTYLSRISLQWPARTAVPFCNISSPSWGWNTVILGFNKLFGLSPSDKSSPEGDERIQQYIETVANTQIDPLGTYNRYYNSLVLQTVVDGFLKNTGARVIHLSVETEPVTRQLSRAIQDLDPSLQEYTKIPDPESWYTLDVDYSGSYVLNDPRIPLAENDMHPSVTHHRNFAETVYNKYFQ